MMKDRTISTSDLLSSFDNPKYVIVDTRSAPAYNGWRLRGETRGGHIPGAVHFPRSWIEKHSNKELTALLNAKGLTEGKTAIIYGNMNDCGIGVSALLEGNGINLILLYEAGIQEWAADPSFPMENLTNYEKLVYPEWIDGLNKGMLSEHSLDSHFIILEASWGGRATYEEGHIPGAVHLDLTEVENPKTHNLISDEELSACLLDHGITHKSAVILYSRDPMAAARAAWMLMYAGVEDVRILNGGFDAWHNAKMSIETTVHKPKSAQRFGAKLPTRPEYLIGIEALKKVMGKKGVKLVSVRSWKEYLGETSGYKYIRSIGRIPGAIWGYSGTDSNHLEDFRNVDNTMRSYNEIRSNWQNAGIYSKDQVVFYCGTGWRASEAFFCAYLMGWEHIAVYDGGWFEWSQDANNPIEWGI